MSSSRIDRRRNAVSGILVAAVIAIGISTGSHKDSKAQASANIKTGSKNQTNMMIGPNITGSIPFGPTIDKAIASQVHVSLANASETAEKVVGDHSDSVAVRIGVIHGFLVYAAVVVDDNNNFHSVLVDAGNGKVLVSTPMSLGYLSALVSLISSGTGMMMGPGMMGQGMFGYGTGLMQHGMMRGPE